MLDCKGQEIAGGPGVSTGEIAVTKRGSVQNGKSSVTKTVTDVLLRLQGEMWEQVKRVIFKARHNNECNF